MTTGIRAQRVWLGIAGLIAVITHGPAWARSLPDPVLRAGANSVGLQCTATRSWKRSADPLKWVGDQAYELTCEGVSPTRVVAEIMPAKGDDAPDNACASAFAARRVEGWADVRLRQCFDRKQAARVIEVRFTQGGKELVGRAGVGTLAPMIRIMRALAEGGAPAVDWQAHLDTANLAEPPEAAAGTAGDAAFDRDATLAQGAALMRSGEQIRASRVLNDALSRKENDLEIRLATALADSDIGQFAIAGERLALVEHLLAEALQKGDDPAQTAYLQQVLKTYRILDRLNRHDFDGALGLLDRTAGSDAVPTTDPDVLSRLNRAATDPGAARSSLRDTRDYAWQFLAIQLAYARAIALFGKDRADAARAVLVDPAGGALAQIAVLSARVTPESIGWLRTRIAVLMARLAVRDAEAAPAGAERDARVRKADFAYVCALRRMTGSRGLDTRARLIDGVETPTDYGACPVSEAAGALAAGRGGAVNAALLAIERGAVAARDSKANAAAIIAYDAGAVETLATVGRTGVAQPTGLSTYLRLLLGSTDHGALQGLAADRYFVALQVAGNAVLARDLAKLESSVTAQGGIKDRQARRDDLRLRITQLKYQIDDVQTDQAAESARKQLSDERARKEAELDTLEASMASAGGAEAQDDRPLTISQLQQSGALAANEAYLKVARINGSVFAATVTRDKAFAYEIAIAGAEPGHGLFDEICRVKLTVGSHSAADGCVASDPEVRADPVRKAAAQADLAHFLGDPATAAKIAAGDPATLQREQALRLAVKTVTPFDVPAAYRLFRLITGPAYPALDNLCHLDAAAASAGCQIDYDPADELANLPLGVMVGDAASLDRYAATARTDPFDFRNVGFIARHAVVTWAPSPRAYLIARQSIGVSNAPRTFLGFGGHKKPDLPGDPKIAALTVLSGKTEAGADCQVNYETWTRVLDQAAFKPIDAAPLSRFAAALGASDATVTAGDAFNDLALDQLSHAGTLEQYQVLHFGTHGLSRTEQNIAGCRVKLPALLLASVVPPAAGAGKIVSDGLITDAKVAQLHLNANLVVLAACDTYSSTDVELGRKAGLEDLEGSSSGSLSALVHAFFLAKARAVLATTRSIPVEQSNRMMEHFYSAGRNAAIGESLRVAQNDLMDDAKYSHPYYWGSFFLVGDPSKTMISNK